MFASEEQIRNIVHEAVSEAVERHLPPEYREYIAQEVEQRKRRAARIEELKRQVMAAAILGALAWMVSLLSKATLAILNAPVIKPLIENTWLRKLINFEQLL